MGIKKAGTYCALAHNNILASKVVSKAAPAPPAAPHQGR